MDDLIQSGNIVLKDQGILDMGCVPYGYFRYVQGYTFMRKYADDLRYYVDEESYLYKEPTSKRNARMFWCRQKTNGFRRQSIT